MKDEVGSKNEFLATNESSVFKKMMKIPHLLLCLSMFSFFLSSYSSSFLIHSPNNYFHHYYSPNSPPLPLLNKSCLFLICNALLIFLAKTSSSLVVCPSDLPDALQRRIDFIGHGLLQAAKFELPMEELDNNDYLLENKVGNELEDVREEEEKAVVSEESKEVFIVDIAESEEERDAEKDGDEEGDYSRRCWIFDHDNSIDYELVNYEEEDREELNKRIESFLKRMKEEIIINEQEKTSLI